ncbi:hypothetical protein FW778_08125 [Ginsengibacter hankyongi]|uniref:DUF4488 domain-containing protein n=1 Tax=Ginsengibacter hankyongi TaxID=2607284 RepID=A0A5J5ILV6_9BACT|nr:hypothetical protein [Ginsengibacter hankyongi]KAA9041970.1 hypothetical protein FW778_08125 [Ginsengibacter hankyongi]
MKILLVLFLLPLKLLAQDVTGVWTGTLYSDTTKQYLKYELAISEDNRKLSGYSYTIFLIDSIENIGIKSIKIKRSGNHYFIEDNKLIDNNYSQPPAKGVKTYSDLVLSETDSTLILSGPWKTNRTKFYESITGNILLHKNKKILETLIIPKLIKLGLANTLSFMRYDTYSKDLTIKGKPVINPVENKKPDQNLEKDNSTEKSTSFNSPGKKEMESKVRPTYTDTQNVATINKPALNNQINKSPGKDIINKNLSADNKPLNSSENKKIQGKAKQVYDSSSLNITYNADQKNRPDNNKNVIEDSDLHKKSDTTFLRNNVAINKKEPIKTINKKDKEIVTERSLITKPGISKKDVSKIPSINTESGENKSKKKNDQLITAKDLSTNKEVIHPYAPPVIKAAAEISSRQIETVRSVNIKNDSLLLTLYDNGEIDGDTVSVLLNGKVIWPMQGLTANGISKTIYLTPQMGDSLELIMYAENLGSIPPNTGLLVVHDGDAVYEIRFSGDLKKNSAIILKRKKKLN